MVLLTYCTHCNSIIGHIHLPYRKLLNKHQEKLVEDPTYHNVILNEVGLGPDRDCCRNDVMNKLPDYDLEKYLRANIQ